MLDGLVSPQVKGGKKYSNFFRVKIARSATAGPYVSKASSAEEIKPLAELHERKNRQLWRRSRTRNISLQTL